MKLAVCFPRVKKLYREIFDARDTYKCLKVGSAVMAKQRLCLTATPPRYTIGRNYSGKPRFGPSRSPFMISRLRCSWCLCLPLMVLSATLGLMAPPASADTGHARIIRLSLVQGDVRFTRDTHGDPLTDSKNLWENA